MPHRRGLLQMTLIGELDSQEDGSQGWSWPMGNQARAQQNWRQKDAFSPRPLCQKRQKCGSQRAQGRGTGLPSHAQGPSLHRDHKQGEQTGSPTHREDDRKGDVGPPEGEAGAQHGLMLARGHPGGLIGHQPVGQALIGVFPILQAIALREACAQ